MMNLNYSPNRIEIDLRACERIFITKIGFDTTKSGPSKIWRYFSKEKCKETLDYIDFWS